MGINDDNYEKWKHEFKVGSGYVDHNIREKIDFDDYIFYMKHNYVKTAHRPHVEESLWDIIWQKFKQSIWVE